MSDEPIQQIPQGTKTKREVGKRNIYGTFGTLLTPVALCLHNWTFWVFIIPGLVCLAFCLSFQLKHLGSKKTTARNWGLFLFVVGLLGSSAYWFAGEQVRSSLPQSNIAPTVEANTVEWLPQNLPFLFSISTADALDSAVKLTNSFLFVTNFEKDSVDLGCVLIPKKIGQSNILIQISVKNNSFSSDCEFGVSFSPAFKCIPSSGWIGVVGTPGFDSWAYRYSGIFHGDTINLPQLQIPNALELGNFGDSVAIMVKTTKPPVEFLGFKLFLVTVSTNIPLFHKPVVVLGTNFGGHVAITLDQFKNEISK